MKTKMIRVIVKDDTWDSEIDNLLQLINKAEIVIDAELMY